MTKKENIVFVLESDTHLRNYISSNVLTHLQYHFDCHFLVHASLKNDPLLKSLKQIYFYRPFLNHYALIFELLMWRYRKKSKSFRHRVKRTRGLNLHFYTKENIVLKTLRLGARTLRFFYYRLKYISLANPLLLPLSMFFLDKCSTINKDLKKAIDEISPKLILSPSSAYSAEGVDLVKISKKMGIKSIFIIDNWDNISSKSIIWEKPDRLLVWGEQTRQQAIKIQGFNSSQVQAFGASRFDQYFELRNEKLANHFGFKYILYVGFSLPFNEAHLVKHIDDIITQNSDVFGQVKLIYRPHPNRQGKDSLKGVELKNTLIDPQLESWYLNETGKRATPPSLEYYPSLLQNAEFVVASLTSMIIESLIFRKKTLLIAYKEGKNPSSPYRVFHDYHHFDELPNTEGIEVCFDIDEFEKNFIRCWKNRDKINIPKLEQDRQFLVYNSESQNYSERLYELCRSEIKTR